jgi:hypothetical protein
MGRKSVMMDTPLQSGLLGRWILWGVCPVGAWTQWGQLCPIPHHLFDFFCQPTYCSSGNAHPNVTAIHPSC